MSNYITTKCLEIEQPLGKFYIGVMKWKDLINISKADVRRLVDGKDTYLGIQRRISDSRVKELRKYVNNVDATFPTGVILAVESQNARYVKKTQTLEIRNSPEIARVIDGQHRIEGLKGFEGKTFDINGTIFVDMDIEDQAMVFAKINLAQTKVNRSLAYDLYEYTVKRSPQKTAHDIVKLLNSRDGSPFYRRIKTLGFAENEFKELQILTQSAFVEQLLSLISGSLAQAEVDRELLKNNQKLPTPTKKELENKIFFNMFADKKDEEIALVLWNYFSAIERRWPKAWRDLDRFGSALPRTNGFRALMGLLPIIYRKLGPTVVPKEKEFAKIFAKVDLRESDFARAKFRPGSSGEKQIKELIRKRLGQVVD